MQERRTIEVRGKLGTLKEESGKGKRITETKIKNIKTAPIRRTTLTTNANLM